MKAVRKRRSDGEATRAKILAAALELFRRQGFETTTMRDVARAAGVATGAAYHYFPTKSALVHAYYGDLHVRHARSVRDALPRSNEIANRLHVVFKSKIEQLIDDRRLLGALFRHIGDPNDELSVFSPATRSLRDEAIELYVEAIRPLGLPAHRARALGVVLWLVQLALILFLLYDPTPDGSRTRRLVLAFCANVPQALELFRMPGVGDWIDGALREMAKSGVEIA